MGNGGQKARFGLARCLGGVASPRRRPLGLATRRDVATDALHVGTVAARAANRHVLPFDPAQSGRGLDGLVATQDGPLSRLAGTDADDGEAEVGTEETLAAATGKLG